MKKLNGLHISKEIRKNCINDNSLYTENGKCLFDSILRSRYAVFNILKEKNISISAVELYLISILETIILNIARSYVKNNQKYYDKFINTIKSKYDIKASIKEYLKIFPTNILFENEKKTDDILNDEELCKEIILEMIQLNYSLKNPAYGKNNIVFENNLLSINSYKKLMDFSEKSFAKSPFDKSLGFNLADIFTYVYKAFPNSLIEQLQFFLGRFPNINDYFGVNIQKGFDAYKEETKPIFFGPGESVAPNYEEDIFLTGAELYSEDEDWMPNVVLLAKNALVWLEQLSKKYKRDIKTLNEIPDEELEYLSKMGINGLWLIGVWERSVASKQIKQWTGNPEAESSAYSLKSYTISERLGGESALEDLKKRAKSRNIRLAADMVPNHTAIDSPLLYEHPDWYLQLDYCPYPNYTFSGVNLADSDKYGVYLEDHYFQHTDAAVVFKYEDFTTHQIRYIYHGNDGTNMPWNDTAQLDYLKSEVREYVKNTILEVAKKFPIIRFDAAMTLTKKHFQRLWYPEPGKGGDIPTRSEHGLTKDFFDEVFPNEFWREVVDLISEKAPDTLLLAEAFWLLEGYFVRTLGMHRVYNSAFMNMLRDEDNRKYKGAIKLTLQYDREILKRYVNFMSNPDEDTAINQFGGGDKYFGICLMMATLPGLPMFAHGQFEGYKEKYGMEYSKSYWNESPNEYIFDRHKREVFPILKRRHIFSNIENFRLYDFKKYKSVDDDVFVYTNKNKNKLGLFIYNNAYKETEGYIKESVEYKDKRANKFVTDTIENALGLNNAPNCYLIYKDYITGLEYIKSSREIIENGLSFKLKAYEYHVFMDFRLVYDDEWGHYGKLWNHLQGMGVPSIKEAYLSVVLGPLHIELRKIFNKHNFNMLWKLYKSKEYDEKQIYYFFENTANSLKTAKDYAGGYENEKDITDKVYKDFKFIINTNWKKHVNTDVINEKGLVYVLYIWMIIRHFGEMKFGIEDPVLSASLIEEWQLKDYILDVLPDNCFISTKEGVFESIVQVIKTQNWLDPFFNNDKTIKESILDLLSMDSTESVIKVHRFDDILWFNKECALILLELMRISGYVNTYVMNKKIGKVKIIRIIEKLYEKANEACEKSEYKFSELLKLISEFEDK